MGVLIKRADGELQEFDRNKLLFSLRRAGATPEAAEDIAHEVEQTITKGATTRAIYTRAFARLKHHKRSAAARYSLKRAILDFGPSGFPFETYIAALFRAEGFKVKVDQIVRGACTEHEVDVVVDKKSETVYVEAKFHNSTGFKTDIKTALYVQARVEDIADYHHDTIVRGLLVTNTKMTTKVIEYAQCKGLELLSWDYPQGATLHERVAAVGLYPVTVLTTLSSKEKTALLKDRVVLCRALPNKMHTLARAGISGKRADRVIEEVGALCTPGSDI